MEALAEAAEAVPVLILDRLLHRQAYSAAVAGDLRLNSELAAEAVPDLGAPSSLPMELH